MTNPPLTINRLELQGFRAYLQSQTLELASGKKRLSVAIFGPNARGKSSIVDSFEYFFSEDATLKRLGKRSSQTYAGPTAIEHVRAKEMGIAPSVHLWFSRKGKKFDATRRYPGPRPDTASRILADVKVPFIIRGHGLRNFVERTTPGEQYKELANWFGLDPLLKVQQNLRNLRRAMKSKAESTSEVEERSRDLQRETNNEISEWDDQEICRWVNEKLSK